MTTHSNPGTATTKCGDRMYTTAQWATLLTAIALTMTACGGNDNNENATPVNANSATQQPDAVETTTTPDAASEPRRQPDAVETTTTTTTPDAASEPRKEEQLAMDAWAVVFDSEADFAAKAPHLENAAQLEDSNAAYSTAGESFGGFRLKPTDVSIDGDIATVTYDVLFGDTPAYQDISGTLSLVDGVWVISQDSYCGFLSSARAPCQI